MTPDQITQVQQSFRAVLPIQDQAAALFYGRLFEIDPGLQPLFAHTNMAAQGAKLMAALGFVVGALQDTGPLLQAAQALAVRHAGYGVRHAHYASVGQALLWTLEAGLGSAWTPELQAAWAAAYTVLSRAMMGAAPEPAAGAEQGRVPGFAPRSPSRGVSPALPEDRRLERLAACGPM